MKIALPHRVHRSNGVLRVFPSLRPTQYTAHLYIDRGHSTRRRRIFVLDDLIAPARFFDFQLGLLADVVRSITVRADGRIVTSMRAR